MAENTFKTASIETAPVKTGPNIFSWLEGSIKLETLFKEGIPAQHLPKIAFVFFLCLIYIGISHQSNRTIHKLNKSKTLLEDLRVSYTTQKAELMYKSKQSEVAKMVEPYGLKESEVPPQKVTISK
jgi:hypothetical protein